MDFRTEVNIEKADFEIQPSDRLLSWAVVLRIISAIVLSRIASVPWSIHTESCTILRAYITLWTGISGGNLVPQA